MDSTSTNIQQLPIAMLECIINGLFEKDKLTLAKVNKYFNSITKPVLYKDALYKNVLYHHCFPEKLTDLEDNEDGKVNFQEVEANPHDKEVISTIQLELAGDLNTVKNGSEENILDLIEDETTNQVVEVNTQDLKANTTQYELNSDSNIVESELEQENATETSELIEDVHLIKDRQAIWNELLSFINKYKKYIKEAQSINPDNLANELEIYSKLKRFRLTIDTQGGIEQFKNYNGDMFKKIVMLKLDIASDLEYEVEDFLHHLIYVKSLEIDLEVFQNDLGMMSSFKSDNLTYLYVNDMNITSTQFFQVVNQNFRNLKYLSFYFQNLVSDEDLSKLPIFENLVHFKFIVNDFVDYKILNYVYDAKFWPKLKTLSCSHEPIQEPISIRNNWPKLTDLSARYINPYDQDQWSNLYSLRHLFLHFITLISVDMLKTLFTKLPNLTSLKLVGIMSSQLFDFNADTQLRNLHISDLDDFTKPFVNFLTTLNKLRSLKLFFANQAFKDTDLTGLLKSTHRFPNLNHIKLEGSPDALKQWFTDSMN